MGFGVTPNRPDWVTRDGGIPLRIPSDIKEFVSSIYKALGRFIDPSRWVRLIGVFLSSLRLSQDLDRLQQMRLF